MARNLRNNEPASALSCRGRRFAAVTLRPARQLPWADRLRLRPIRLRRWSARGLLVGSFERRFV